MSETLEKQVSSRPHKFKLRHGILCQVMSGELKDVPVDSCEEWLKHLSSKIKGY